jgi:hypothetical protein
MLISWETEWSQCLDVLGDTVNINVSGFHMFRGL